MREPRRSELLEMKAHLDAMLSNGDGYGWHGHLSVIRALIDNCIGDWYKEEYYRLEKKHNDPRKSSDPECVELAAAVDAWKEAKAQEERKVSATFELGREEYDKLMREAQEG